jgi:hypothetical protein
MRLPLVLALGALLAGCGATDMASMPIQDSSHSLTLVREKPYAWSQGWDVAVVVARMPDCQRRHHLRRAADGEFRMEVFHTPQDNWILRKGQNWYITETRNCQLQQFKEAPAEPGTLVGAFEDKGGQFRFVRSPEPGKPAAPAEAGK